MIIMISTILLTYWIINSLSTTGRFGSGHHAASDRITLHRAISHDMVRVIKEVTFGRGDLSVCPLGGFIGAQECLTSK